MVKLVFHNNIVVLNLGTTHRCWKFIAVDKSLSDLTAWFARDFLRSHKRSKSEQRGDDGHFRHSRYWCCWLTRQQT